MTTINIAVNRVYINKLRQGDSRWSQFNNSFNNTELTLDEIIDEIQQGHAITSPHKHEHVAIGKNNDGTDKLSAYRHSENWEESSHLGLDHDDLSIHAALGNDFIVQYGAFVHTTASHTKEAPRSRTIFILDRPIRTRDHYAKAAVALTWFFEGVADSSCNDVARLFFGAKGCKVHKLGNVLPVSVVNDIIDKWEAAHAEDERSRQSYNFDGAPPELQELRAMLRCIPKKGEYRDHWLKVVMGVHHSYPGSEGVGVLEEWSPGYKGEIERKFKSFKRNSGKKVTIASVIKMAKAHGYEPPKKPRASNSYGVDIADLPKSSPAHGNGNGNGASHADDPYTSFFEKPHNTDMGNALRMYGRAKNKAMYVAEFGKWYTWGRTHWQDDNNFAVLAMAKQTVLAMYKELSSITDDDKRKEYLKWIVSSESRARIEAMIALLRSEPGISVGADALDQHPMLLPCPNGEIDLTTADLLPSDPAHKFTRCINVEYDPSAECPLWEKFLIRIMGGNLDLVSFIQRLVGHALTGDATGKYFVFMWGEKGNNGKSTLAETIMRLLGPFAMKSPTEMVMAKAYRGGVPNDIARLRGVRFTVANEVDEGMTLSEGVIKDLTGQDTLSARFMRGEFFDFVPTHKLWMYGNHRPDIRGTNPAIWDRVKLIPFEVEIPENERDLQLQEKLAAELPGILAWAVRGCLQWQKVGINAPEIVKLATGEYKAEQDMLGQFIDDCCEVGRTHEISAGTIYQVYEAWCKETGIKAETGHKFGRDLGKRGFGVERNNKGKLRQGIQLNAYGRSLLPTPAPHWSDER